MAWLVTKYLITTARVVAVSEFAKRSGRLGGFAAAPPLVTVATLVRLCLKRQMQAKIANHAWYTFRYVLPALPTLLLFPWLLTRPGLWPTLLASVPLTCACFGLTAWASRPLGIRLLP